MNFFPKNPKFFDMFEELADTVRQAGTVLPTIKIGSKNVPRHAQNVRKLELIADTICHRLAQEANSTFITPIDREDIHALARNLDNIIDQIEEVTSKLLLYNVTNNTPEFHQFATTISTTTTKIQTLVNLLRYRNKHVPKMRKLIIEIHSLENDGDELIRKAVKSLFSNHKDTILIMKWKDILENMEGILDESESMADIVDAIIVKNF